MSKFIKKEQIKTYQLSDLVGRNVDIRCNSGVDGEISCAIDTKTREIFILKMEEIHTVPQPGAEHGRKMIPINLPMLNSSTLLRRLA